MSAFCCNIYLLAVLHLLGFDGGQGNILGPSFDSSPDLSEWLAMKTLVQCDDNVMTFTASGGEFIHLLVDRGKICDTYCEGGTGNWTAAV